MNGGTLRHVDAYLQDSRVGAGQRQFLILEERGSRLRLLYVPFVLAFWVKSHDLQIKKELTLKGLARRIRHNRAERRRRKKLGSGSSSWSVEACREALERLALATGEAKKSAADQADDWADATFSQADMEKEVTEMDDPKLPAEETDPPVVPAKEPTPQTGGGEVETQAPIPVAENQATETSTEAETQETDEMAKAAKKTVSRGVKIKKEKAPKAAKANGSRRSFAADKVISVKAKENPRRGEAGKRFDILKDGMTVGDYIKRAVAHGTAENVAISDVRYYADKGWISVS